MQYQGAGRHSPRAHERRYGAYRQHGCDGGWRRGPERKPGPPRTGMGGRANESSACAYDQRLDREGRCRASDSTDRARHAAAARPGARSERARALHARPGTQGGGDLDHRRADGTRRCAAAAVLGPGRRARRRRLHLSRGLTQADRSRSRDRHAVGATERRNRAGERRGAAWRAKSLADAAGPIDTVPSQQRRIKLTEFLHHGCEMIDERLLNPISTGELERRWAAVRKAMAERNIDALVMQNNNDWLGGYVRWFTDTPLSNGYPRTVIFPASDLMIVVDMGPRAARRRINCDDAADRGVGEMIFTPAFTNVAYTDEYQAELVAQELLGYRTIGWLGSGAMPHRFVTHIERELAGRATFVDATELVDRRKAIKSAAGTGLLHQAAEMP